ncbi:MAG: hypothetical protein JW995_06155 [Melioribacteraceae bacterium]|nr:hypothetical protein [Melioribacteraceae bacterium]
MQYAKLKFILSAVIILTLLSCAPGNEMYAEETADFWDGLWHGFISVVTLIIGIFDQSVKMYETINTGWWYNLGFLLGAGFAFSNVWFSGKKVASKNK